MKKNAIVEQMRSGRLTRRDMSKMLAAAGLGLAMVPVGRPARAAGSDLTYFTWSGYELPGFHPSYIAKNGESPSSVMFSDEEEALQKLRAGMQADVVHPCSGRVRRWHEAGVIQPFDTSRLSNWGDLIPMLTQVNGANDDGKQWFAPVDWGNTGLLYRSDLVDLQGQEPSWSLLWDERYAGQLSIGNDITDTGIITGLLAGAADPYKMTDEDIAKVRELMMKQQPLIRFYWSDTTELETAMASGEVVATSAWNSSVVALRKAGVAVEYAAPKEGILSWCCGLVLSSNAEHIDLAYDLIDAMISPEGGAWMVMEYGYGHSNTKTFSLVDEAALVERGLPKDPLPMFETSVFSAENARLDELQQMFEEVKAGL